MSLEQARQVADAVLYEGYVLYPYRASAQKNQLRWQFGVLAPAVWCEAGGCENSWMQTECLVQTRRESILRCKLRFLQLQRRTVERATGADGGGFVPVPSLEVQGRLWTAWDEGLEREVDVEQVVRADEGSPERTVPFEVPGGRQVELLRGPSGEVVGRLVRESWPGRGELRMSTESLQGPEPLLKVRVRVENVTSRVAPEASRDEVLPCCFTGAHTLLEVQEGAFLSLVDPPAWAQSATTACLNVRTWPVLGGAEGASDVVLSSPIILYDHPQIAAESPGDLYDATEIDEILTLRTLALTEDEKREARATDARAAAVIDRVDQMPAETLERLHGAIRYLRAAPKLKEPAPVDPPWWDPGADASVSPETDSVEVGGVSIAKGSRVWLRPGARRADAQDMFLAGRTATVHGVFLDVENQHYLAVTLDDDPAAEFFQWHGRYLYFSPDEIEPQASGTQRASP